MNLFGLCFEGQLKAGTIQYVVTSVTFGTSSPSNFNFGSSDMPRIPHLPTSWHLRFSCVLDYCHQSQKTEVNQTSGHIKPLECYSTTCNAILHGDNAHAVFVPRVPVCSPGGWYIMRSKAVCVVLIANAFPGSNTGHSRAVSFFSSVSVRPSSG